MLDINNYIEIGYIKRTHGTQGEVAAVIIRDFPEDSKFIMLLIDGILVPFYIEDWRYKSNDTLLLCLEDINTEANAKPLVGCKLYTDRLFYNTSEDELLVEDIIGFNIISQTGERIGRIVNLDQTTINTLIMVDTSGSNAEGDIIIPYHEDLIIEINIETKYITMELPEGLTAL